MEKRVVSKSVLKRLPLYRDYLRSIPEGECIYISATALANALELGEVQVRKDLALVSKGGKPKVGYLRSICSRIWSISWVMTVLTRRSWWAQANWVRHCWIIPGSGNMV